MPANSDKVLNNVSHFIDEVTLPTESFGACRNWKNCKNYRTCLGNGVCVDCYDKGLEKSQTNAGRFNSETLSYMSKREKNLHTVRTS